MKQKLLFLMKLVAAALTVLAGSALIVWPVWLLATKARFLFNILIALLFLGFLSNVVVRAILRAGKRRGAQ